MALVATPHNGSGADKESWETRDTDARETARMLKTLIANIDGMVYRCHNDSQWTMEFVSDGCLAVTGYRAEDLIFNRTISYEHLTHPEDRLRVRSSVNASSSSSIASTRMPVRSASRSSGSRRSVRGCSRRTSSRSG